MQMYVCMYIVQTIISFREGIPTFTHFPNNWKEQLLGICRLYLQGSKYDRLAIDVNFSTREIVRIDRLARVRQKKIGNFRKIYHANRRRERVRRERNIVNVTLQLFWQIT